MIMSDLTGRLRIRSPLLRSEEHCRRVGDLLTTLRGVRECRLNARSGSLLVIYDPEVLSRSNLLKALEKILPLSSEIRPKTKRELKYLNISMLLSLSGVALGALIEAETLHVISGLIFFLALGFHLYKYRKVLLWR